MTGHGWVVIDPADRPRTRWANGRGTTRPLANAPDEAWRLSVADIVEDADFSVFPGLDRVLVVVSGTVRLTIDGRPGTLYQGDTARFAGEAAAAASVDGPALVVNLMLRRGAATANVSPNRLHDHILRTRHFEIIVLLGAAMTDAGRVLPQGATLLGHTGASTKSEALRLVSNVPAVHFVVE